MSRDGSRTMPSFRLPMGWWVVILILPALAPLVREGFYDSHDGLIHIYRLEALEGAVRAGALYPRWFPEFAFGYGHPVLNFYGPLSYYWGLPFMLLGADAVLALKLVFATGLIASALGMYRFARLHLDRGPGLVAAVAYAYLPYHLVDLYVRGAVAEFLAFVWFPLVLWAFHRLVDESDEHWLARVALAALLLTALVTTHSLSTLIFAPVLAGYLVLLLLRQRGRGVRGDGAESYRALGRRVISRWGLAVGLAVVLSVFYWLPVLAESQYVGLGHSTIPGGPSHLVSLAELVSWSVAYRYPTEAGVTPTFPLGLVQVLIVGAAVVLVAVYRPRRWLTGFFLAVGLGSIFMLTTLSMPVWLAFEGGLAYLQYPWRFQALAVLSTAFLAGALCQAVQGALRPAYGRLLVAGCVLVVGTWALWRLPVEPTAPDLAVEAMWQRDQDHGQVGATWTGEYLPIWVQEQRWALSYSLLDLPDPAIWPATEASLDPAVDLRLTGAGYNRYDFTLEAPERTTLALHQFHYPGWEARWQGKAIASRPEGELGLAAFDLPPGSGSLSVRLGLTAVQRWATLASLAAALVLGAALVAQYQLSQAQPALGFLLLAAGSLLLACVLLASLALPNGYVQDTGPVKGVLEDTAELLAYGTDREEYRPGDTVQVSLYWLALRRPDQDYKSFVHLTDEGMTAQPAQHDGDPGGGFTPTTRWLPGEVVPDRHPLLLPPDLAPGRYRLWAGLYEHETVRNLAVLEAEVPSADDRLLLGEIEVRSP